VHLIPEVPELFPGHAADASCCACNDHRTVRWLEAVVFEPGDGQSRCKPRRANRHRVDRTESGRQRHHPVCRHTHVLRIAAVMGYAQLVAMDERRVARTESGIGARLNSARDVDAGDQRKVPDDPVGARCGERVLVVDAGIGGLDDHIAWRQLVESRLNLFAVDLSSLFENPEGAKWLHTFERSAFICRHACRASSTEPSSSIVVMSPGSRSRMTAFNTRRMIFPLRVFGSVVTKFSSPMTATGPNSRRSVATSACRSSADGVWPRLRSTNAEITSPRVSSGPPTTPHAPTA